MATAVVEFVITEHPSALTLPGQFDRPVLGICAGMPLQTNLRRRRDRAPEAPEVGYATIEVIDDRDLLDGLGPTAVVYEHHAHGLTAVPEGFVVLARSEHCAVEANRGVRPPLVGHAVPLRAVH